MTTSNPEFSKSRSIVHEFSYPKIRKMNPYSNTSWEYDGEGDRK